MTEDRLHELMQKHLASNCTPEEQEELAFLIAALTDEELKATLRLQWNKYSSATTLPEEKSNRILTTILSEGKPEKPLQPIRNTRSFYIRTLSVAASILLLVAVGVYTYNALARNQLHAVVAKATPVSPAQPTAYIRNITLPDGSTVILKAGSTLQCPKQFTGNTREIVLSGEAYFDIAHNKEKPFIIHTGDVKTTVLGTAFNIKAWPNQKHVTVSVTRGRVKVQDAEKILAVLTVNQSVDYDLSVTKAKTLAVNAEGIVTDWTKQDMVFNRTTFESIAQILSKRYGVNITIDNASLANEKITSSFSGTESLENILEILCAINANTQYAIHANDVTIIHRN